MCGIIGYVGESNAPDVILRGLKRLEYRGYDSSGVAVGTEDKFLIVKSVGKIAELEQKLRNSPVYGNIAIGHTRWATHGGATERNAHPFLSYGGRFVIAHNGIIENYLELRSELVRDGVSFASDTDSEVVAHLMDKNVDIDVLEGLRKTVSALKGSFALVVLCLDRPDEIFVARKDSPLVIGNNGIEGYVCSDINTMKRFLPSAVVLDNARMAIVSRDKLEVYDFDGVRRDVEATLLPREETDKEFCYECHMDKEMDEIPAALSANIRRYRADRIIRRFDVAFLKGIRRINIVGCGTALHAGKYAERLIKRLLRNVDVIVSEGSEFRYDDVIVDERTLNVTISQSGETADTLFSQNMIRSRGGVVLNVGNVETSSMARGSDVFLPICAGEEIAVASTKAYNCQEMSLLLFILDTALIRGDIDEDTFVRYQRDIDRIPILANATLGIRNSVSKFAKRNYRRKSVFYLGRGMDYVVAREGGLKLKEISYVHCEAYPAGELKHGTLALIEKGVLVIVVVTDDKMIDKTASAICEVKARGADVLTITPFYNDDRIISLSDEVFAIPFTEEILSPIISVIPTQLLAYYTARYIGCDVDRPRNLAKSVTVE